MGSWLLTSFGHLPDLLVASGVHVFVLGQRHVFTAGDLLAGDVRELLLVEPLGVRRRR